MRNIALLSLFLAACGTSSGGASATSSPPSAGGSGGSGAAASSGSGGTQAGGSDAQGGGAGTGAMDAGTDATPGRNGDLGGGSPVIDHSGANGGFAYPPPSGAISGTTWSAPGCGDVPIATGVSDVQWSSEVYDPMDPTVRDVHTSFRFDTATSLSVVWASAPGTYATTLAYGDSPDKLDHFVAGVSFTYMTVATDHTAMPLRVHETHVCGLTPGKTYWFAVGGDGYYGKVYPVKTAPAPDPMASFRIGVIGDSNNIAYGEFQTIAGKLRAAAPDWVAFTGDLVHDGAVQTQWDEWFAASGDLFASAPIMTAHGNHEMMATGYFAQFALPGNEEYYSFDYAQAHFVVLNDSPPADSEFDVEAQFLDQDLAAAVARPVPPTYLIAMHHRPPYSSPSSFLEDRDKWCPIYDKYHVDLVLNGHQHVYESTKPLKNQVPVATAAEGTIYVTTGGAGAILTDPPGQQAFSSVYQTMYNYVVVDVAGKTLTLRAYGDDGTMIDQLSITK